MHAYRVKHLVAYWKRQVLQINEGACMRVTRKSVDFVRIRNPPLCRPRRNISTGKRRSPTSLIWPSVRVYPEKITHGDLIS